MSYNEAETLKTLVAARRKVSRGWTKHNYHRREASASGRSVRDLYCAVGAIQQADGPGERTALIRLAAVIRSLFRSPDTAHPRFGSIVGFNDAESTTKADVLRAFDAAIARTEELAARKLTAR